jgi:hypothetical protein
MQRSQLEIPVDVQAGGFGQGSLSRVETEEIRDPERDSQANVEKIHAAHPKFFRVSGRQVLGLPENINPGNRDVLKHSAGQVRFNFLKGLLALIGCDFAAKDPQSDGVPHFETVQWREGKRMAGGLQPRQDAHRFRLGRVSRHQETGIRVNSHGTKIADSWPAVHSIRPRLAVFDDDVRGKHFVTINALEAGGKVRTLRPPLAPVSRRWRKQGDNLAALADADGFAFFNPIQDAPKIVPQLPDCGCFHVEQ